MLPNRGRCRRFCAREGGDAELKAIDLGLKRGCFVEIGTRFTREMNAESECEQRKGVRERRDDFGGGHGGGDSRE